jgi:nucleoside-diphosphate-sugar epimerase
MHKNVMLLTGATGFIGRVLGLRHAADGWQVRPTGYRKASGAVPAVPLAPDTDWTELLDGVSAVVHLGGRAHVLKEQEADPLAAFRYVNTAATLALARQAAQAGVRRFVFMSSIGVNGAMHAGPVKESDPPRPNSPYAVSKLEAELGLRAIAADSQMEVTILRPPLVYGPNVGARFLQLLRLVGSGVPLPFGAVQNSRSLLGVHNLADAVAVCLLRPEAANETFLVADKAPVSTPELISMLADAMERPHRLFSIPPSMLRLGGRCFGKGEQLGRLLDSLVADTTHIQELLRWSPPVSTKEGIAETAKWFLSTTSAVSLELER